MLYVPKKGVFLSLVFFSDLDAFEFVDNLGWFRSAQIRR
jgi:hypothetical protein